MGERHTHTHTPLEKRKRELALLLVPGGEQEARGAIQASAKKAVWREMECGRQVLRSAIGNRSKMGKDVNGTPTRYSRVLGAASINRPVRA